MLLYYINYINSKIFNDVITTIINRTHQHNCIFTLVMSSLLDVPTTIHMGYNSIKPLKPSLSAIIRTATITSLFWVTAFLTCRLSLNKLAVYRTWAAVSSSPIVMLLPPFIMLPLLHPLCVTSARRYAMSSNSKPLKWKCCDNGLLGQTNAPGGLPA